MESDLLEILCCPESKQELRLADPAELASLNASIARGEVREVSGKTVSENVSELLVRKDGARGYAVRGGIPILLVEDGLLLEAVR